MPEEARENHVPNGRIEDALIASGSTNRGPQRLSGGKGSFCFAYLAPTQSRPSALLANVADVRQIGHSPEMPRQSVNL